jgi:acetyl-CoA carboxylase biotin carboxyl carrier protein
MRWRWTQRASSDKDALTQIFEENMVEKPSTMQVDVTLVRALADMLNDTGLTEISVKDGDRKIKVSRGGTVVHAPVSPQMAPPATTTPTPSATAASVPVGDHPGTLKSPMVGTVYLASSPEAADFVSIGATVKEGDTVVIIEAMKVMNPILATRGGTVTQILIGNAQPVEFDQPLVVIE